jgi:TonB family protein
VLLRNENQFGFKRAYLIGSLLASLLFPLVTIQTDALAIIPALSNAVPATWLSEIIIYGNGGAPIEKDTATNYWSWVSYTYLAIVAVIFVIFLFRIAELVRLYIHARRYAWKRYVVAESEKVTGVFSFFHFIFLSPADQLDAAERLEILRHEEVHIQKFHSLDIVLINLVGIVCWFNPVIRSYKKSLVQIHEFEADARSVEGRDVNVYCSLLAKVALQSHGYILANHFTNSLTLKRITMMKTVRKKISQWKIVSASVTALLIFFVVACQDQVVKQMDSTLETQYPNEIQKALNQLQVSDPNTEYAVIELNENGKLIFKNMSEGNVKSFWQQKPEGHDNYFVIVGYRKDLTESVQSDAEVFSVVDESAEPIDGMTEYYKFLGSDIKYPEEARLKGISGRVFVEFVVNLDGSISDIKAIKGIGYGCDEEAVRVMSSSPHWKPGKKNGSFVKQRMVIPINFALSGY